MSVPGRHDPPPATSPLRVPLWRADSRTIDVSGFHASLQVTPDTPGFAVSRYVEPLLESSPDFRPPVIDLCGWEGALALGLHLRRPELGGVCANFTLPAIRAAVHNLAGTNWTVVPCFGAPAGQLADYNTAFLRAPYWLGNDAVRALIRAAFHVLRPGGELWLAGERRRGSETYRRFAELQFDEVQTVLAKRHTRVFRAVKCQDGRDTPSDAQDSDQVTAADLTLAVARNAAVFSNGKLDPATRLLAESLPTVDGRHLDFGCGSGVVAAVIAQLSPGSRITAIDSNLEAVSTTRRTLQLNRVTGVDVRSSYFGEDLPGREFDLIACHPPFHVGPRVAHDVARRMLAEAARMLKHGGAFYVVLSSAQAYEGVLHCLFGRVLQAAPTPRHRVLVGERPR